MSTFEIILIHIHGIAMGAFIMNVYWSTRIGALERKQTEIRRIASNVTDHRADKEMSHGK